MTLEREAGGIVPCYLRHGNVGRHNQRSIVHILGKGHQLTAAQVIQRFVQRYGANVGILAGIAMAGEMLEGAGNARIGKPGARPAHKVGGGLRFTAERAGTDDRVIGVGVHIGHRGKIQVKAVFF